MPPRASRAEARILIPLESGVGRVVLRSLSPEVESLSSDRSRVTITQTPVGVAVEIEADDVSALRAAANSYLYWIQSVVELSERIKKRGEENRV